MNPRLLVSSLFLSIVLSASLKAQVYDWNPTPDKVDVLVISTHPDDEGIFMGSVLPYMTQVRQVNALHLSMTSGDYQAENGAPDWRREEELRAADWVYGFRNEPIFARFRDYPTNTVDETYDIWADGILGNGDSETGRELAANYLAEQIRRFQPEVLVVSDLDGEYGHSNHRATSQSAFEAYERAMDPLVDIAGLDAWQPKKYYIHQSQANGLGTAGVTFENWLFHDYTEDISIDTDGDGVPDATPRQVADWGLDEHVSQGSPDVSTVFRTGENFDGHHTEWWGLYDSTVGPDTLTSFEIEGQSYTNWARGDFFENVFDLFDLPTDINQDGIIAGDGTGPWETDDVTAFIAGWGTTGHGTNLERLMHGDINLDNRTSIADWQLLVESLENGGSLDLANLLQASQVPEPSSLLLVSIGLFVVGAKWRRS
ncbi:PIG-L family deacetylase [Aeoliella mucimassa]|uniref:1D-myo-inositol 2-acetamido-2-deoxy-alpha-D-glucopyranoside deacetylase n=1 Tax=Aeoliella mucimassa TaxID=2527972 RepID=A0A518AQ56_9BACT|nr:PIG-L family deacetylase [Aeoliella mucimassa]QDU56857.1 1D-myo-inositol 2-acetamido-2-deoxy-alpha-D-glucopyranoside deacetylase [Aeoliella mucimassa]